MESGGVSEVEKDALQAVQVAVHIRPLIAQERIQGCKECVSVVPGEPQVQLGSHSFTFDHVYGGGGSSPSSIFDQCVRPLVEGLFQGYNATVLAYGQTGSGKTYTMGTGYTVGGSSEGVIPQVMNTLFSKINALKHKADFQVRVSFIEILKEEVHDLLDPNPPSTMKTDTANGGLLRVVPGKPPIQIRETGSGGIMLAGVTETEVRTLPEMAACLEQGSLCRATGSTNMNAQSSRSHAIFTINVEQRRKWDSFLNADTSSLPEDTGEDFLCAKLHLVDLAGSERAKRTKADGNRFKEGVHINRGLLALGNVISALGDDKKRKEGGHVPYRDSKLTRLLQDSLGGNSRTTMIACVSPADSNAEETLNTLKYANRARNIQNKPMVNRDPVVAEMQRMRQQLEVLQAELLCAQAATIPEEIQILKQKVTWLESNNLELRRELQQSAESCALLSEQVVSAQVERDKLQLKFQKLRSGVALSECGENDIESEDLVKNYLKRIQELELELLSVKSSNATDLSPEGEGDVEEEGEGEGDVDVDVVAAKELEHTMRQDCLDKELEELDKRLELKEAEMKAFARPDNVVLKQHFEKKLIELEDEKKTLQKERDALLKELEALATSSDEHAHKMQETYVQKLKDLERQIAELKKKQENQAQLLRQKQRSDEAAKRLQEDILRMKQQKVQLQNKIKQESEQFRAWKNAREKEVLQLRKEGRRNVYEMHKLQALHQRQKLVLQRKTEEAAVATRRLKDMLEASEASYARSQLRIKEIENRELRKRVIELSESLKQSEARRMEFERDNAKQRREREQPAAVVLATASKDAEREINELSVGLAQLVHTGRKSSHYGSVGFESIPYDLRKAPRESYKSITSESSECETDMEIEEIDQSDKDWDVDDEKYKDGLKLGSAGCCSCSQTSGCKTKKCQCRLAGGYCGASCSCKASKCANREHAVSGSDMAGTSSASSSVQDAGSDRGSEELAKYGAKLLDTAYKEELSAQITASIGGETVEKPSQRRPLSDIGNTRVVIPSRKPGKQKRKSQKIVVQLVPVESQPEAVAPPPQPPALPPLAVDQAPQDSEVEQQQQQRYRHQREQPLQPRTASVSPLRARNRHRARDDSGGVKRVSSGPPSPRKKHGDEKENIR
ncbi:kinesin-like protein KIN-4A [Selaginella moellendorffii]|uniref:kinesin-like protein KIN-4A n=1 Tax=Selaginella moellendorffii TaxID=88036 RepID=UPI000D1C7102|nr:kinesin-like protein KIN-4A [Selaginella moellendorffii]|eukprot:XP_024515877.1 kinesin-like protein KIN-4A [Selaginella moellendorffii]